MLISESNLGAPLIHGELLKLGIDVAETTVAKFMPRNRKVWSSDYVIKWDCPPSYQDGDGGKG